MRKTADLPSSTKAPPWRLPGTPPHHSPLEISGSLLYLQPGSDDLEYATLVSPLPLPTPNWANQSLSPSYSPAFSVGFRYIPIESNDFELNWTHLNASASASCVPARPPGKW